jgi:hypothetical protein
MMRERKLKDESADQSRRRLAVEAISKRLSDHCGRVLALVNGFERMQLNNPEFSLDQPFYSSKSSLTMDAIKGMMKTYQALRRDVREIAETGYVEFENSFPELDINFETYYSVAFSLLNLVYQMQLMKLYCSRLVKY